MGKVPTIIPITDLRQDAASVLKRVRITSYNVCYTKLLRQQSRMARGLVDLKRKCV